MGQLHHLLERFDDLVALCDDLRLGALRGALHRLRQSALQPLQGGLRRCRPATVRHRRHVRRYPPCPGPRPQLDRWLLHRCLGQRDLPRLPLRLGLRLDPADRPASDPELSLCRRHRGHPGPAPPLRDRRGARQGGELRRGHPVPHRARHRGAGGVDHGDRLRGPGPAGHQRLHRGFAGGGGGGVGGRRGRRLHPGPRPRRGRGCAPGGGRRPDPRRPAGCPRGPSGHHPGARRG